jgi:hypothetical protein
VKGGTLKLQFGSEQAEFSMKHASHVPNVFEQCHSIDVIERSVLETSPEFEPQDPEAQVFVTAENTEIQQLCEVKTYESAPKSSASESAEPAHHSIVELKELPAHLKYAFLEKEKIHPVIIGSALNSEQEESLLSILKLYKNVIGYSIDDIIGISEKVCSHRIHLEEGSRPTREGQRRLNPAMEDVVKKEVLKLLKAGMIYPISDSEWVSPIHIVPKKGGYIVVENEEGRLMTTRPITGWRMVNDFRKLNKATKKDHFPLPFMDQMLERLTG